MSEQAQNKDFSTRHQYLVIIIAGLVSAMGLIDATALNVALPFIQSSLNVSSTDIHWVFEIYLLFLAALMLAGGALGDSLGRRRTLLWGVCCFAITSLGCALSNSAELLILFRALQGMAAAFMLPASLALINAAFPPADRGVAIGKWATIVGMTVPLGPLIGGLAVDFLSWHYVFLLNIPICAITIVLLAMVPRPPYEPPEKLPLDVAGSVLITIALGLITYALLEAGREGVFTKIEVAGLFMGVFGLVGFFYLQTKLKSPMLPSFLMTDRRFILVSVQTLVLFAGFQTAIYFLGFLYIQSFGYSALQAGGASLPVSIIVAIISASAGRYASKHGPRLILFTSSMLMALALFWLSFATSNYFTTVLPGMILMGLSVGLFAAPLTTVAMASAGPGRDGLASGVSNAVSRIGPLIGIAIFGYWIGSDYAINLTGALMDSGLSADKQSFLVETRSQMAAISLPESWPEAIKLEVSILIKGLFASSVQETLRICALFAVTSAVLSLFYRRADTR